MALLTTFEGVTSTDAIIMDDLFDVNDFLGIKLFGQDAWQQVKQAAAIIAKRAVNAPILFYIRSQGTADQVPGTSSDIGRKLWGYNDKAGVELLGAATWGAVKTEFDELLGFNPLTYVKKALNIPYKAAEWVADKLVSTNIPVIKETGQVLKYTTSGAQIFQPAGIGERTINLAISDKGYVTQEEIDEAYKRQKAEERQKMLEDQSKRAGEAAAAAAAAQAEYQAKIEALEEAAKTTGITTAAESAAIVDTGFKTAALVGGTALVVYLLTRRGKK